MQQIKKSRFNIFRKTHFWRNALSNRSLNWGFSLIWSLDKGFSQDKNAKKTSKFKLSSLVTRPGFEPRQTESESVVLPLYYQAVQHKRRFSFIFGCKDNLDSRNPGDYWQNVVGILSTGNKFPKHAIFPFQKSDFRLPIIIYLTINMLQYK